MADIIVDTNDLDIAVRIKGPKGDTGDSAYKGWLSLGNTGTMQDFLDSLKSGATALSNQTPAALSATPAAGNSSSASRSDHAHKLPNAVDVGAEPAGAILAHTLATNPHTQYAKSVDVSSSLSAVATQITGLQTFDAALSAVVDTKASSVSVAVVQTNLDTLSTTVDTKASTTALTSTSNTLQANIDSLTTVVGTKATSSQLTTAITGVQTNIDTLTTTIGTKEPAISSGTTGQYWRGDKTWTTLDKGAVGLGNVDNTSDVSKPVSTATQTVLNLKASTVDLSSTTDSNKGAGSIGLKRTVIADAVSTVGTFLSTMRVSVWEVQFVMLITSKPTSDPKTWDWTPAIQAAIDYSKSVGCGNVEIPEGTYSITRITRRNGVSIIGRGCTSTYLQALPYVPSGSAPYGMVEIENGPVIGSHMRGIHLLGLPASNPNQWGMYLQAKWDAAYVHGGLWMTIHDDIRVTYFNYGIWSRGGYTINNYARPQQFLQFNHVFIQVPTGGEALRLTGQHGQVKFTGGSVDGRDGQTALRCVTLDYDPDPSTMADNASGQGESTSDVAGTGNSVQAPINVIFGDGLSAQKSQQGFYVRGAQNIVIKEIWAENVGKFLYADANSQIVVEKNHLAKAANGAMFGSAGNGYLLSMQANSSVVWKPDNQITGITDNGTDPTMSVNNILGADIGALSFGGGTAGKFNAASAKVISINSQGFVDMLQHDYVLITPFNADLSVRLRTLNGPAAPGKIVRLRAQGTTFSLGQGTLANISLNGLTGITVPNFGTITLQRIFQVGGSGEWIVLNYPEHYGTAIPTSGYYVAGTKIWNSAPAASSPMGWVCVTSGIAGSTAVFKTMPNLAA